MATIVRLSRLATVAIAMSVCAGYVAPQLLAREYIPYQTHSFYSSDRAFRVTVVAKARGNPGLLRLERRAFTWQFWRRYHTVWTRPLTCDDLPSSAIISGDGRSVATFATFCRDAMVIRGALGEIIGRMGLLDFLRTSEIDRLPWSTDGMNWLAEARFDTESGSRVLHMDIHQGAAWEGGMWRSIGQEVSRITEKATTRLVKVNAETGVLLRPPEDLADIARQRTFCESLDLGELKSGKVVGPPAWNVLCLSWRQ